MHLSKHQARPSMLCISPSSSLQFALFQISHSHHDYTIRIVYILLQLVDVHKQQTSETNPPVRLMCGHAISQDAMKKLVTPSGRLKCPYCPVEMVHEDTMIIHF